MYEVKIRGAVIGDDRPLAELDHRAWSSDSAVTERPPAERAFFDAGNAPGQFLVAVCAGPDPGGGRVAGYIRCARRPRCRSTRTSGKSRGWRSNPACAAAGSAAR